MMRGAAQKISSPKIRKSSKKINFPVSTGEGGANPIKNVKREPKIPIEETIHMPIFPNGTL